MEEQAKPTAERKPGRGFWGYVYWAGAILILYFLSLGPFVMMEEKGVWKNRRPPLLDSLYFPLGWAYMNTPLQKPIGMYLHLWCPQRFANNGDMK